MLKEHVEKMLFKESEIFKIHKYLTLSINDKHNFDATAKFYGIDKTTIRSWRSEDPFGDNRYKILIMSYLLKCNIRMTKYANNCLNELFPQKNTLTLIQKSFYLSDTKLKHMWSSSKIWKQEIMFFFLSLNPYLFVYQANSIREEFDLLKITKFEFETYLQKITDIEKVL